MEEQVFCKCVISATAKIHMLGHQSSGPAGCQEILGANVGGPPTAPAARGQEVSPGTWTCTCPRDSLGQHPTLTQTAKLWGTGALRDCILQGRFHHQRWVSEPFA